MHVWHIKKLKGSMNNNNKLLKSLDESMVSSLNEGTKNSNSGEKKTTKRTPLTDKANNVVTSTEKKSNSNVTSDRQPQRTITTTTK
jgi:hypothetical protein